MTRAFLFSTFLIANLFSTAKAEQIRYLDRGQLALASLYNNISNAKKSVDLTYHIWDPCHAVTKVLVNELSRKALKEKVKVRLQVDAYYHSAESRAAYTEEMRTKGIELRWYNTGTLTMNNRTHAKLTVIDKNTYISGGRNIDNSYYGLHDSLNWVDREVEVKGASVEEASERFENLWSNRLSVNEPFTEKAAAEQKKLQKSCWKWDAQAEKLEKALKKNARTWANSEKTISCKNVSFHMDDTEFSDMVADRTNHDIPQGNTYMSGERLVKKPTTGHLVDMLKKSQSSILLENYSYIASGEIEAAIRQKREQKKNITVYSNDFAAASYEPVSISTYAGLSNDQTDNQKNHGISQLGALHQRWEQSPKKSKFMIHAKVYVVDKKNVMVGSFNMDPRSYHTNIESGVFVYDCPALAKRIEDSSILLKKAWEKDQTSCEACKEKLQPSLWDTLKNGLFLDLY